jgi:peptidoglycan/LPS O-acetylase OafA/YrhL
MPEQDRAPTARGRWPIRIAAGLLLVVGLTNAALAVLSLATDLIHLSPDVAGGLLVLGAVTTVVGVFVWRGSRVALSLALVAFGALMLAEATRSGTDDGALPRLVLLALLVATLAIAWAATRRSRGG